jgi:hypothetical protein
MPPGSASAPNTATPLSKGELDKYYSRIPDIKSAGSDRKKILADVVGNLGNLLEEYRYALSTPTPEDEAWTPKMSQEFLTDVIGQVKAILGDKANKLTEDEKQPLLESLSKANQLKDECNSKLEAVKKAPIKNGSVNPRASGIVDKDDKKDDKDEPRLDRPQTSKDLAPSDKVDPTTRLENVELDRKKLKFKEGVNEQRIAGIIDRLNKNQSQGLY